MALGALLDGIPESIVIGISLSKGGIVSLVAVIGIFISNIPEGLSGTAQMKEANRSKTFIFSLWLGIVFLSGLACCLGALVFSEGFDEAQSFVLSFAAGAMLCMVSSTMIPEAYERNHSATGLITVIGFLLSFSLSKLI